MLACPGLLLFFLFFLFCRSSSDPVLTGSIINLPLVNKDIPICARPMLATHEVPANNIQVSSEYKQSEKLRTRGQVWCARKGERQPWVQVDLGKVMLVAGFSMEGVKRGHFLFYKPIGGFWTEFVDSYSVEYSPDGRIWSEIKDERGRTRRFKSEQELKDSKRKKSAHEFRPYYQPLDPLVHARLVRIRVHAWSTAGKGSISPCMNLEIFACDSDWALTNVQQIKEQMSVRESECHYLNLLGRVHDTREWDVSTKNEGSALYRSNGFMFIDPRKSPFRSTWLRVDMKIVNYITNIKTVLNVGFRVAVKWNYEHSLDGTKWHRFKLKRRTWRGKSATYNAKPVAARYIMVKPRPFGFVWDNRVKQFDVQVFGCSDEVQSLGLWSRGGRVTLAGVKVSDEKKEGLQLNAAKGSWCTEMKFKKSSFRDLLENYESLKKMHWIEIDLKKLYVVSHLLTRGDCKSGRGTIGFSITHSQDRVTWIRGRKIYPAQPCKKCGCMLNRIDLSPTVYARYLKIELEFGNQCLSLDIHGNNPGKPAFFTAKRNPGCDKPLGMQSRKIHNSRITSSSEASNRRASDARLNSQGSWCVEKMAIKNYYKLEDYLLIDLKSEKIIDGFATQGNDKSRGEEQWVTGYVVHYSLDKVSWDVISTKHREKFFIGNTNSNGVVRHRLNPRIRARFIRFLPLTWNNWICMRVEIYGCDGGESTVEKLERDLQDVEAERVDIVPLFAKRTGKIFDCGQSAPWGKPNYLRFILDKKQSVWTQHWFNREVPLFTSKLRMSHSKLPSKFFFSRRFTCAVKTKEGQTLFRHHLLALDYKSPHEWHHEWKRPQLLVFQPIDQGYNGGKIVWSAPATIWVKGSVATMGIYLFGIVGHSKARKTCLEPKRNIFWKYTFLGNVPDRKYSNQYCRRMALLKGYEYSTIRAGNQCYSSWYLPLAAKSGNDCKDDQSTERLIPHFKSYQAKWLKKEASGEWRRVCEFVISNPPQDTARVYTSTIKDVPQIVKRNHASWGRTHMYNQVSFIGDRAIGTNVLEIVDVDADDMGTYKFQIYFGSNYILGEKVIELRHREEPRISLPESFYSCVDVPTRLKLTAQIPSSLNPSQWDVKWDGITDKSYRVLELRVVPYSYFVDVPSPFALLYTPPSVDVVQYFEAFVSNRFGYALARSKVFVAKASDVPSIVWVTKSPYVAIEGVKDVLEVRLSSESNVKKIEWYHNGTVVNDRSNDFSFPGEFAGTVPLRKVLRFSRVTAKTEGQYRVVVNGSHCSFQETVVVSVLLRPAVMVEPLSRFIKAEVGQTQLVLNATIKGGKPKPKRDDMNWKRGSSTLIPIQRGRITIAISILDNGDWRSILTIKKLRYSDSGKYRFIVNTGPISVSLLREIKVYQGKPNEASVAPDEQSHLSRSPGNLPCPVGLLPSILFLVLKYLLKRS